MVKDSRAKARRLARRTSRVISATDAAKTFGGLVDHVRQDQAVYVVERGGRPVAQIGPVRVVSCTVAELVTLLRSHEPLDEKYLDEVEAGLKLWNRPVVPKNSWAR